MNEFTDSVRQTVTAWKKMYWEACLDRGETDVAGDINMMLKYVGILMLAAHTEGAFARISRFLEMQMPEALGAFELCFLGGDCGHARIWVEDISEFDFADAWLVDQFPMVSVKHHEWRTWTADRIEGLVRSVSEDFYGDGYKVSVTLIEGKAGQQADKEVTLRIEVQDWSLGVFVVASI